MAVAHGQGEADGEIRRANGQDEEHRKHDVRLGRW